MVFYRHARIFIGFDCEDRDGNVHSVYAGELRESEFDPVEFVSREEAYDLGGSLIIWADKVAENIARSEAEGYCGDETFHATNVRWDFSDEREWSDVGEAVEIPEYIKSAITVTLERIAGNLDDIDYVRQLTRDLDVILERNGLTRSDISDMIKDMKLENVVKI